MPVLLKLLDDPDPGAQLQLALTLSAVPDDAAESAAARLLTSGTAAPDMMRDCVISGLRGRELKFAELLLFATRVDCFLSPDHAPTPSPPWPAA